MPKTRTDPALELLRAVLAEAKWPDVAEGRSYGRPGLNFRGRFLAGVKDRDTLVLPCPIEEKELLLGAAPDIYFETDHYKGWPAVLARAAKIGRAELRLRIDRAWRARAPKRIVAAYDAARGPAAKP